MQKLSGYDLYFAMARGAEGIVALDMSKFFDTNYHYLVPELTDSTTPKPNWDLLFDKVPVTPGFVSILQEVACCLLEQPRIKQA